MQNGTKGAICFTQHLCFVNDLYQFQIFFMQATEIDCKSKKQGCLYKADSRIREQGQEYLCLSGAQSMETVQRNV